MATADDINLSITENGLDSLIHAVEHFLSEEPTTYFKYVVLHTAHAVELLLKARLEQIDPSLILHYPGKKPTTDDSQTIGFDELISRLTGRGIVLGEQDVADLRSLRTFRNRLEHRRFRADREEVANFVGQAMRFIDQFTKRELGINLRNQFDATTYDTLIEPLQDFDEAWRRSQQEMAQLMVPDRDYLIFPQAIECPWCGNYTVVYPDSRFEFGQAQCFAPGCRGMAHTGECESCGGGVTSTAPLDADDLVACYGCLRNWMDET